MVQCRNGEFVMMLGKNPNLPAFLSWQRQSQNHKLTPTPLLALPPRNTTTTACSYSLGSPPSLSGLRTPLRYAVLGAGFAGLSVAWNLLQHGSTESHLCVDIYDEAGIGGGASGVAGGLLHPYSPKVNLLWRGAECWKESLHLLNIAERAFLELVKEGRHETSENVESPIVRRRGILRPAINVKSMSIMRENAQNCLPNCRIELINEDAAQKLVPNLSVPLDLAFYMPSALNVNAQVYLEGLYLACQNLVNGMYPLGSKNRELNFYQRSVQNLLEIAGDYDAVIICFGARAAFLPELSGKVPLRMCRGVISHLQLSNDVREAYPESSPSILSDAWLAARDPHLIDLGSTWDWKSRNYSRDVGADEASEAMEILLPKATSVYPAIKKWSVSGAVAGLRAMPPLTVNGSIPLVGRVDEYIGGTSDCRCKYWLFTGLGARGLLYHGWVGKLLALAVLSCDENLLPSELTLWKQQHKMHQ